MRLHDGGCRILELWVSRAGIAFFTQLMVSGLLEIYVIRTLATIYFFSGTGHRDKFQVGFVSC
jgi:hypothetical protein